MARKKKQQEQRVKTFSELEAERRQQQNGREAGGSRPASMSFSEMEQYRRNQNDKAIVSYIKNRYPDTVDSAAARQVIRTRDARNNAASMLDSYAKGLTGFQSRLQSLNRTGRPEEDAAAARSTARRAFQDASEIRNYIRQNRGAIGEDAVQKYDALLDSYVRGFGESARNAQNIAKKYGGTEENRKEAKRQDLFTQAGQEEAAIAETRQRAWYDTNEMENQKAAEMADYMAAVRRGDVKYDEATAEGIRKKYDDQIEAMRKDTAQKYGTKGSLTEQLSELEARNLETRKKGEAIYGDEIKQLQDELYNTRDPEKRRQIEERLSQIEYFDTRERNLLEIGGEVLLAGGAELLNSWAGTPHRIMESLFPGYMEGEKHNYEADTIWEYLQDGGSIGGVLQFLYDQTKTQAEAEERRLQEMLRNKSGLVQFVSNATTSVVPMLADMVLASTTGGLGILPEAEGLIDSTSTGMRMLRNLVNSPYFYSTMVQEFASTWDEEVGKGVDPTTAGLEAMLVGVLNAGIELGFGVEGMAGVQELPGDIAQRLANAGTENAKVNVLKEWLKDAISEGNEEVMQKFVGDLVEHIGDPDGLFSMYDEKSIGEFAEAWGGGALVGGLMGAATGVENRIAEGRREQYTQEDEQFTRYLEELARQNGQRTTEAPEAEEVQAPQNRPQEAARTAEERPEAVTEEEEERAAMTPEERQAAEREAREAERDLQELVEESEEREDRSEETEEKTGPFGVSGTNRIETGSDATIAGVESVRDGEMIFRLSDGSTVNAEDVKYANLGEATVAEAVATLGVDRQGAEILLREWAPDRTRVSGEIYAAGVALAYNYGLQGYRVEEVAANRNLRSMTENQIRAAYELGRIERDERARRSDERRRQIAPTEARESRGGVRIEAGAQIRGETQEAQVKALDAIGKAVGVRIVLYDGGATEAGQPAVNGFYDARDRTVHINIRAGATGDGVMLNTAAHELTHYIHDTARTEYNKLADFLFSQYGKAGVTLSSMIAEEKQAALESGRRITNEEAMMEVVADSMETMLADGTVVETLTRENRSLAQRIADKIGDLVKKIRAIGQSVGAETLEGRIVSDAIQEGEAIRELWTNALRKAAEVGTATEAESDQEYVSYSVRRARSADRTALLLEATAEDAGTEYAEAIEKFLGMYMNVTQAEAEVRELEHEISVLEGAGRDQNSDRIQELNEELYEKSRAAEEGRFNLRRRANSKELRALADKVLQRRIAETEALEEAVPQEPVRTRTLSEMEERAKEIASLRRSNEQLKKKLAAAKEELTVRDSRTFRRDDLDKFTRSLLKDYQNSQMDPNEVRKELEKIGRMMIEGDADELNDHLHEAIRPLAEEIITGATEKVDFDPQLRAKLFAWMRSGIKIPAENINDLDPSFRKQNSWWIRINKGESVDVAYQEMATQFGEGLFPADVINPADQAMRIYEVWQSFVPIEHNPHEGIENAMIESVIQDVVDGMISESMRLQPQTTRERFEAKIEETERILKEERSKAKKDRRTMAENYEKMMKKADRAKRALDQHVERADKIAMLRRITSTAKSLERDLTGQSKNRVMERFRKPVAELVAAMDINMPAYEAAERRVRNLEQRIKAAGDNTGYRLRLEQQLAEAKQRRDYLERKHAAVFNVLKRDLGTGDVKAELRKYAERGIAGPLERFIQAYANTQNIPGLESAFDSTVYDYAQAAMNDIGEGTTLARLPLENLKALDNVLQMVRHHVRNGERLFLEGRQMTAAAAASKIFSDEEAIEKKHEKAKRINPEGILAKAESIFLWDNMKMADALERIGSPELTRLWREVRNGELQVAKGAEEARNFQQALKEKYDFKSWNMDEAYEFKAKNGKTASLTLEQMMQLYAHSKTEEAQLHLSQGGFINPDAISTVTERDAKGKKKKTYKVRDGAAYAMGIDQLSEVIGALSDDQKAYVDAMMDYLMVMGDKGNVTSLKLHGARLFNRKNYFPMKVASVYLDSRLESTVGEKQIKNMGFTKALVPNANSPLVLEGFDDVWKQHVAEMELYCGYALPLEDFTKVYNYKIHASETDPGDTIKAAIERAWGKNASGYIETMLKDVNGAPTTRSVAGIDPLLRKFKVAATATSLSTIVQQHTSWMRALPYIEMKYFGLRPRRILPRQVDALYEEMKTYAPVATIKEMGYFDTGTGRSLADYIGEEKYSTFREKATAFFTDGDYRMGILGLGAEWEDKRTWVMLWEAAKRKAAAENRVNGYTPDEVLNYSGNVTSVQAAKDRILTRAGQIVDEACLRTQVYDSVFTRSQNMRKRDPGSKMVTSFMAEPTTAANQFISGIWDMQAGRKARGATKMAASLASAVAAAVASSFIYALRDKDDDKTYPEKLAKHMTGEVLDELNPLTYFPVVRDIVSLFQGYDVTRSDMALIANLIKSITQLASDSKPLEERIANVLMDVANLGGIPVKNLKRDLFAIKDTTVALIRDEILRENPTTAEGMLRALREGFKGEMPEVIQKLLPAADKKDVQLYKAWASGNEAEKKKWTRQYKDEETAEKAVVKVLAEQDERIAEAAKARLSGDAARYGEIMKEIEAEGRFTAEMAAAAEKSYESKVSSAASKLKQAYEDNDMAALAMAREDLVMLAGEEYAEAKADEVIQAANEEAAKESGVKGFSIYKAADVAGALDTTGAEAANEILADLIEAAGGEENAANVRRNAKSAITSRMKPKFQAAAESGNRELMEEIIQKLADSGLYGARGEVEKTVEKWIG